MKYLLLLTFLVSVQSFVFSQEEDSNNGLLTVGIGYDFISFRGDLNKNQQINSLNNFRGGYNLFVEKRFLGLVGIAANMMYGKVSQYEATTNQNFYFKTDLLQVDARASLYLDNKFLLGHQTLFTPFLSAGIGFLKFSPYGDLKNENGKSYNLWDDGSLRDLPQGTENANVLDRDFTTETALGDFSTTTFVIPITVGVNIKLSDDFNARVAGSYIITGTDYIEGISTDATKDKLISTNISLTYTIKKRGEKSGKGNVDLNDLFSADTDFDGVSDDKDKCQNTPDIAQVDADGCPLDFDNDGVPDYIDKEQTTKKGAIVNELGETLTDNHFKIQELKRDSIYMKRITSFHNSSTVEELEKIDKQIAAQTPKNGKIPTNLKFADTDNDKIIHSKELLNTLNDFLDGAIDIPISTLFNLIDFFFEQ